MSLSKTPGEKAKESLPSAISNKKGEFIFRRRKFIFRRRKGKSVANGDIPMLSKEDQRHLCELDWGTSAVLLPPGCYLNHACDPNAMRKGSHVYAWRNIAQGEEITIDYRLNAFTGAQWECYCGSANCRGYVVSDFFSLDEQRQEAYLPYAPQFIRNEYQKQQQRNR